VSTQEVLLRTHELVQPPAAGTSHLIDISSIQKRLSDHETRKEERRIVQMRTAREKARRQKEAAAQAVGLVNRSGDGAVEAVKRKAEEAAKPKGDELEELAAKRRKLDSHTDEVPEAHTGSRSGSADQGGDTRPALTAAPDTDGLPVVNGQSTTNGSAASSPSAKTRNKPLWSDPSSSLSSIVLTKPSAEMRGHTSYLTFASFYPASIRQQLAEREPVKSGVARLADLARDEGDEGREGTVETEFGSDGMDQVMGTLTEEEMIALAAGTK